MARGSPIYASGSIGAGAGVGAALWAVIKAQIESITSNGVQAWGKTTITVDDLVYHSVGDRTTGSGGNVGDTDIWIRWYRSTASNFSVEAAQDYSPTTGSWASGGFQKSSANAMNLDNALALDWYFVGNEYEAILIVHQNGAWYQQYFGSLIRVTDARINGAARITSQSGTGDGVVMGVDRDISANIQVGQKVFLLNQTPDGVALQSVTNNFVTVAGKSSSTITVDGVTNTYAEGSLLGLDPAPSYVRQGANVQFCQQADATFTYAGGMYGNMNAVVGGFNSSGNNPSADGTYPIFDIAIFSAFAPYVTRGYVQLMLATYLGTQTDLDIMEIEWDVTQKWKIFAQNPIYVSGMPVLIGPGAS